MTDLPIEFTTSSFDWFYWLVYVTDWFDPGGKGTRIYALNARYDRELCVKNAIKIRVFTPS